MTRLCTWQSTALVALSLALGGCSSCDSDPRERGPTDAVAGDDTSDPIDGETTDDTSVADSIASEDSTGEDAVADADVDDGTGSIDKLDLLWVIDNSGGMCRKQTALRDQIPAIVDAMTDGGIDAQMAVTTTHNIYATQAPPVGRQIYDRHLFSADQDPSEDTRLEPLAEAGQIQRYPNPPLGFSRTCHHTLRAGQFHSDEIAPIKRQLSQAIQCTKSPGDYESFQTNNRFETLTKCAVVDEPEPTGESDAHQYCENAGKTDGYSETDLAAEIFPCGQKLGTTCSEESEFAQVYRELPKVLRLADYAGSDGTLNASERQRLIRDFRCMSFVGVRGRAFEQGLRAAMLAVHPAMTGGPVGDPFQGKTFEHPAENRQVTVQNGEDRPNHGLLRSDATTGVVFYTDENDCSHRNHTMLKNIRDNSCGELNCYFPTKEGSEYEGDLIATSDLYDSFVENLEISRRLDRLSSDDFFVAAMHGNPTPYGSPKHPTSGDHVVPDTCGQNGAPSVNDLLEDLPVCVNSTFGRVFPGDRYSAFLDRAKSAGVSTVPLNPTDDSSGSMCSSPDLHEPLAEFFENQADRP